MKKLTAIMMVLMMALVLVPGSVLADSTEVLNEDKTYSTGGGTFGAGVTKVTYRNCTFSSIVEIMITPGYDIEVVIEGCTFTGTGSSDVYACVVYNAAKVTVKNNTVTGFKRGFNIGPNTAGGSPVESLVFTGNNITLVNPDHSNPKSCGVQLIGDGWEGANVNISSNTIANATNGVQLRESFKFAAGDPGVITLVSNTFTNCKNATGYDPDAKDEAKTYLAAVVGDIVIVGSTEVKAGVDPTYIIIIPATVNFGTLVKSSTTDIKSKDFKVEAQNVVIETGSQINVSLKDLEPMKAGSAKLDYELYNKTDKIYEDDVFYSFTEDYIEIGSVRVDLSKITAAGAYSGTMTFAIAYVAAP